MSGPNPWGIDDDDQNYDAYILSAELHEDVELADPIPGIDDTPDLASGTIAPAASPVPSSDDDNEYSDDETTLTEYYNDDEDHPLLADHCSDKEQDESDEDSERSDPPESIKELLTENLALTMQAAINHARQRVASQRIHELTDQQRRLQSENQALRTQNHTLCFQLGHSQIDNAVLSAGQSVLMAQQHYLQTQENARTAREELQALAPPLQRMN